jgi:hypothetical protein
MLVTVGPTRARPASPVEIARTVESRIVPMMAAQPGGPKLIGYQHHVAVLERQETERHSR